MSPLRTVLLSLLGVLVLSAVGLATIVVRADVEKLTDLSDVIVDATVESVRTEMTKPDAAIWTIYEMRVSETLAGTPRKTITVHVPGGTVGGLVQEVSGVAKLSKDGRAVLFLAEEGGRLVVLGEAQGCFHVTRDTESKKLVCRNDIQGLAFVEPTRSEAARAKSGLATSPVVATRLSLADLRARVASGVRAKAEAERLRREAETRRLDELRQSAERNAERMRGKPGGGE